MWEAYKYIGHFSRNKDSFKMNKIGMSQVLPYKKK